MNVKKDQFERIDRVRLISESFEGEAVNLVDPRRVFLREGLFVHLTKAKNEELQAFLFNDCVVFGKPSGWKKTTFQFKGKIDFDHALIKEIPNSLNTLRPGRKAMDCKLLLTISSNS